MNNPPLQSILDNSALTSTSTELQLLSLELIKERKISKALLKRVKANLERQANVSEVFEHNSLLLYQIRETKKELYNQSKSAEKLNYMARHDALTGLLNRNEFELKLKQAVIQAKKSSTLFALCFLDLDQFKVVNDTSGHLAGDEMLKQLSTILQGKIKAPDSLARLGGDEFGLVLQDYSVTEVKEKTIEIMQVVEDFRFLWDKKIFKVSVSVGIALIDSTAVSYTEILKQADIACYEAKNSGRNRLHIYQEKDESLLLQNDQMQWVPRITEALERDQFRLYAQTIKPTDSSLDYVHYEILIRFKDDSGKIIPPGAFLPTAERYNLITKIDLWVIEKTFEWLSKHIKTIHPNSHFSINLSGQSLGDEKILKCITHLLNRKSVPAKMVHFEVTETMAISNLKSANQFIKKIKSFGCGFSLDDFGSGLSSFGYLKNLAVDTLKIDGIFVRDIIDDPIDAAMVDSINTIGHVMGLKTIAEFVENDEIAKKLCDIGVDYLQGYGISKPVPIDDILS